jgi:hypothetical protein
MGTNLFFRKRICKKWFNINMFALHWNKFSYINFALISKIITLAKLLLRFTLILLPSLAHTEHVYNTEAWAASGCFYTTETFAASGGVSTTRNCAAPGGVYTTEACVALGGAYTTLSCIWTCKYSWQSSSTLASGDKGPIQIGVRTFSAIPEDNFTINIKLFQDNFTCVELLCSDTFPTSKFQVMTIKLFLYIYKFLFVMHVGLQGLIGFIFYINTFS